MTQLQVPVSLSGLSSQRRTSVAKVLRLGGAKVVDVAGGRVVLDPPGGLLASDAENLVVSPETGGAEADTDTATED